MPKRPRRRRCDDCDGLYVRRQGKLRCDECHLCFNGDTAALQRWWLNRFELDELRAMADALWPDLSDELPWLALAS